MRTILIKKIFQLNTIIYTSITITSNILKSKIADTINTERKYKKPN